MTNKKILRRVAGTLAATTAACVLAVAGGASPAQACTNNAYRVVWDRAGVYDHMSHNSYRIKVKMYDQPVTGPAPGWAHMTGADGNKWTRVWVHAPGFRDGWMRDDAVTFTGCA